MLRMIFWFTDYHLFHSPVCVLRVSLSGSSLIGPRPPSKDRILSTDTNFSPYLSLFFFVSASVFFLAHTMWTDRRQRRASVLGWTPPSSLPTCTALGEYCLFYTHTLSHTRTNTAANPKPPFTLVFTLTFTAEWVTNVSDVTLLSVV